MSYPNQIHDGRRFNVVISRKRTDCETCGHATEELVSVLLQFDNAPDQTIEGPAAELFANLWEEKVRSRVLAACNR